MAQRRTLKKLGQAASKTVKHGGHLAAKYGPPLVDKATDATGQFLKTPTGKASLQGAAGGAAVGWALPFVSALVGAALGWGAVVVVRTIREKN